MCIQWKYRLPTVVPLRTWLPHETRGYWRASRGQGGRGLRVYELQSVWYVVGQNVGFRELELARVWFHVIVSLALEWSEVSNSLYSFTYFNLWFVNVLSWDKMFDFSEIELNERWHQNVAIKYCSICYDHTTWEINVWAADFALSIWHSHLIANSLRKSTFLWVLLLTWAR